MYSIIYPKAVAGQIKFAILGFDALASLFRPDYIIYHIEKAVIPKVCFNRNVR